MELTMGRVFGPNTEWPRVSFCDIQVNVNDISLSEGVSLAFRRSLRLPEVVHAALIKADWIPLLYSCERSCMDCMYYCSPMI